MKNSPAEKAPSPPSSLYAYSLLWSTVGALAQSVCILAVIEPDSWHSVASFARWVYVGFYALPLIGMTLAIAARLVMPEILPKNTSMFWQLVATICNIAVIVTLVGGEVKLGLMLSAGSAAFAGVRNWILPHENQQQTEEPKAKPLGKPSIVFFVASFILVVSALQFHSVLLALLLFVSTIAHSIFLLVQGRREIEKAT